MARTTKLKPLAIGIRVKHAIDGRSGIIVGSAQPSGRSVALYPVTVEGATRTELWPEHHIKVRRKRDQFPAHGGTFQAPNGYPLYVRKQSLYASASGRRSRA